MIYTLTLNPSIDCDVRVRKFVSGTTNRADSEGFTAGGKGINVSAVLKELGVSSYAMGFTAGFTGEEIERQLAEKGIVTDFVRLPEGSSRINIKIHTDEESEINAPGPDVSQESFAELLKKIDLLCDGDTLVIGGSIPKSMPQDCYETILSRISGKNIKAVVDSSGEALLNALNYHPYLIKPNRQELSELFDTQINSTRDAVKYAEKLKDKGAENVIVSLGSEGAILYCSDGMVYYSPAVPGKTICTVGAGDSMIAGFIAGMEKTGDYIRALHLGTVCGCASSFSFGLASAQRIHEFKGIVPMPSALRL